MEKLEEISVRRKAAHARLVALKSKVYEGFLAMEKAAYADGALPKKQKELIAVGISVARDCESCMQWHIEQAVKSGASFEEVLEAIEVAIEMGGGRATVSARFALEVMDAIGLRPAGPGQVRAKFRPLPETPRCPDAAGPPEGV